MICRFCNSALASGVTVCTQCGAPQPGPASQAPPSRQRQVEFRVSWGGPVVDVNATRMDAPLAAYHAAPPPQATRPGWVQQQIWVPAPRMRSFHWQAFIALVLYFPFFLPGLIANIIWWNQARNLQAATGIAPRGKGCLTVMLVFAVIMMLFWAGIAGIF